ncbi:TadE/TadG family type IV pilus assembly protein [Promicromonospora panici]|uniref:TadE/TadG family type IV pilus assembly protein n=1 Tax=Promicromonospora panici TaxID=2219658 RepID=UPI00101DB3ED|nr:TadE/TadG family type IV pilus assembly protein [Promicromonospora panici]
MPRLRTRGHRERGAAAVEFALVLPILLLLIFGIVEIGRAYYVQTTLSAAAREGVRVMALQNDTAAARSTTKNVAGGLAVTDSQISVTPTTCSGSTAGTATVKVTYPVTLMSGLFGASITLTGTGTMRCHG